MMFSLTPEELSVLQLSCRLQQVVLWSVLFLQFVWDGFWHVKSFGGKSFIETLVFLPLVLPPVVPGYLLLQVFGSRGIIGQYLAPLGIDFAFNWKGAVLASAVMGFRYWCNLFV